jgi:hypothetical protein
MPALLSATMLLTNIAVADIDDALDALNTLIDSCPATQRLAREIKETPQ